MNHEDETMPGDVSAMSTAVTGTLTAIADELPVSTPPWPVLERRLRGIRRRRRTRAALRVGGGALAVVAVVGGVQLGALPYPSWAPAVVIPASARPSALYGQPARGSLAGDSAFLDALRRRAAAWSSGESGGEAWKVASAADVHVIFAGDVGDRRIALVETPVRWGVVEDQQQLWFVGPSGTAAAELDAGGNDQASDVVVHTVVPDGAQPGDQASVVVLAPGSRTVELARSPIVRGDGTVSWDTQRLLEASPGTWTTQVPVGNALIRVSGEGGWRGLTSSSGSYGERPPFDHPVHDVLGPVSAQFLHLGPRDDAWMVLKERLPGPGEVALWSGTLDGWDVAVLAQRSPSAGSTGSAGSTSTPGSTGAAGASGSSASTGPGWFVSAAASRVIGPAPADTISDGTPTVVTTGTQALLGRPAGPVGDLAVALRLPDTRLLKEGDPGWDTVRPAPSVALLAPERAVTAQVRDAAGSVSTVRLANGVGVAAVVDAVHATFFDAAGGTVADVDVAPIGVGGGELRPPD